MLTGAGLGIWSSLLKADANGLTAYNEMIKSKEFLNPSKWVNLQSADFDGIVLPGGHKISKLDLIH
jgi:protease I